MRLKFSCTMKESDKTIVHLVTKLNSASSSSLSWPRFYTTTVSPLERDRTVDDWRSDVVWFSIWSYQFTSTLVPATYMKSLQMMKAVIENNDTPTNIQPNSDGWTCWFTVPSHDLVSPKGQYIMEVLELDIFTSVTLIHWLMMHGTVLHWVLHCAFLKSFFGTPNGQTMGGQKNYVVLDLHVANQIRFRKSTKYVLVIKIYQKRLLDNWC